MDHISKTIRTNVIKISHASGHGHIPTCFSIVELLRAVYEKMRHDPKRPDWEERDIFILSKGHGALALYCTMAQYGYFSVEDLYGFGSFESRFGCHPDRHTVPGVELSTGSLGHGIGVAAGYALGFKLSGSPRRVFVIIGDGESNEGTVWEALMVAAHMKLNNLCILLDFNRSQTRCLPISEPEAKFAAFGCETISVDGHDLGTLYAAIDRGDTQKPRAIIAHTVKGKGCQTLERDMFAWHRRSPSQQEVATLLGELV